MICLASHYTTRTKFSQSQHVLQRWHSSKVEIFRSIIKIRDSKEYYLQTVCCTVLHLQEGVTGFDVLSLKFYLPAIKNQLTWYGEKTKRMNPEWTTGRPLPSTFRTEGHADTAGYFSWANHECTLRSLRSRCRSSEPRTSCRMKISLYSQRLRCSSQAATSSVPQRWTVRHGKAGVHWVPRIPEDSERWGHHQRSVPE